MKFIHTADNHLGAALKSASFKDSKAHNLRTLEHFETFNHLIDQVDTLHVDLFFIAGDLFDQETLTYHKVEQIIKQLAKLNADVFIIIGNHDTFLHKKAYQSLLSAHNIHLFSTAQQKVALEGVDVYGFNTSDFNEGTLLSINASLDKTKKNVLLLHGDIKNPQDAHYLTNLNTLKSLAFDYIGLGHIHKHDMLDDHIAYSGNPEPLDFSETKAKGYILGNLETKTFDFVPCAKRLFIKTELTVNDEDDLLSVKDKILKKIKTGSQSKDFHRITIKGTYALSDPLDFNNLKRLLEETFYYIELRDETKPSLSLSELKKTYPDTIIETLIEHYEKDSKGSLESLELAITALLKTEEVTE